MIFQTTTAGWLKWDNQMSTEPWLQFYPKQKRRGFFCQNKGAYQRRGRTLARFGGGVESTIATTTAGWLLVAPFSRAA